MSSKVFTKFVLVVDNDSICFCDKDFYKTCRIRVINELDCKECSIRITPIDRESSECSIVSDVPSIDENFKELKGGFSDTLKHLKGFTK